jgi:hypothetical protein
MLALAHDQWIGLTTAAQSLFSMTLPGGFQIGLTTIDCDLLWQTVTLKCLSEKAFGV